MEKANVVIVGAGFAGLSAAKALHGIKKVVVMEAGDRVGGRACTGSFDGVGAVEMGATYVHGTVANPVCELAEEAGLMGPVESKPLFWGFLQPGAASLLPAEQSRQVQAALRAFAEAWVSPEANGSTLGQKLATACKQELARLASPEDRARFLMAWRWHEVQLMLNSCSPSSADISSAWWAAQQELPGANHPIAGGFQAVAEWLGQGADLRLNTSVTRIEQHAGGVTVTTAGGEELRADAVIVTVSLGVLKATHRELFSPALPEAKAGAIERLGWGFNEKIFVEFGGSQCSPEPPATVPAVAYSLLWDVPWPGPDREEVLGGRQGPAGLPAWAPGIFSFRFGGSEFKPASVAASRAGSPPREPFPDRPGRCYGNSSVESAHIAANTPANAGELAPQGAHPRVACLWVSGWHAQALAAATDEEVTAGIAAILEHFPAIPFSASDVRRVWRSDWTRDPNFRGAYSYTAAAASAADVSELSQPLLDGGGRPVVLFAGEACSIHFTSTTHGAWESGRQAAARLLSAWGLGGEAAS